MALHFGEHQRVVDPIFVGTDKHLSQWHPSPTQRPRRLRLREVESIVGFQLWSRMQSRITESKESDESCPDESPTVPTRDFHIMTPLVSA